jgi:hypothetical protein
MSDTDMRAEDAATDPFVRLALDLHVRAASGIVSLRHGDGTVELLVIRRGALVTDAHDALGRLAARRLDRACGLPKGRISFREGAPSGPGREACLAAWAKRRIERTLDVAAASGLARELDAELLVLRPGRVPDVRVLEAEERIACEILSRPVTLSDMARRARLSRHRALSLAAFLRAADALVVSTARRIGFEEPPPARPREAMGQRAAALRLLGLAEGADLGLVRGAYRRLARALHPDLHPGLAEPRRRELERRLAHLNAAYGLLSAS